MKVKDYTKFKLFNYENVECNCPYKLGDIVTKYKNYNNESIEPEIGVVIQIQSEFEFRTDMFGNEDVNNVKLSTIKEIQQFRKELIFGDFIEDIDYKKEISLLIGELTGDVILNNNKQWISITKDSPKQNGYYVVLCGKSSNPNQLSQSHAAIHFFDADKKEWSSETKYWLADIEKPNSDLFKSYISNLSSKDKLHAINDLIKELDADKEYDFNFAKAIIEDALEQYTMRDLLLKFRNEIRSKTRVGEYEELLTLIENEIDKLEADS